MMFKIFKSSPLNALLPKVKGKYSYGVKLSKYTWFGVGGPAEVLFEPENTDDLKKFILMRPKNVPLFVLGGGSNLLVRDGGIMGIVIRLSSSFFKSVKTNKDTITCGAGLANAQLKKHLLDNEIGGLEFLCSIPGVVGGSIKTNAGCFGSSVSDYIISATIIDDRGEEIVVSAKDLKLGYRTSMFPETWILTSITFKREHKKKEEIEKTIEEHKKLRLQHQPHKQKTAGSTFKNPQGTKAWELIKKAKCDKLVVGGAKVSEKHCNFLINYNNAKAEDIENLGNEIIKKVKKTSGITLEWEIKRVGIR